MKRVLFFVIYCLLGAGISFGQAPGGAATMALSPSAPAVQVVLPGMTNTFHAGTYSGAWQPGATEVSCDAGSGIVCAKTDDGTNYVLGTASEPWYTATNGLRIIREQDDVLLDWYEVTTVWYSPDLLTWGPVPVVVHAGACFPVQEKGFYALPHQN